MIMTEKMLTVRIMMFIRLFAVMKNVMLVKGVTRRPTHPGLSTSILVGGQGGKTGKGTWWKMECSTLPVEA